MKVGSITKQPREIKSITIRYDDALDEGDSIILIDSWSVEPPNEMVINPTLVATDRVRIWISEGVDGREYKATVIVSTNGGERHEDELIVKVRAI